MQTTRKSKTSLPRYITRKSKLIHIKQLDKSNIVNCLLPRQLKLLADEKNLNYHNHKGLTIILIRN